MSLYGKRSLKKIKTPSKKYLRDLKNLVSAKFDEKTGKLREYFLTKKKAATNIVLSSITEEEVESKFFKTFFEKIGKKLIISREGSNLSPDVLTIMPILHDADTGNKPDKRVLSEIYEKHKAKFQNFKIIPLEADSLYRVCVDLGLLFGIKMKKIRKAYEKAVEGINGKAFDCRALLIILNKSTS